MIRNVRRWKPGPTRLSFYILVIFTLLCGAAGGSARADEPLLVLVRIGGVLALAALILVPSPVERRAVAPLPILLSALGAVVALQLIPLPPAIWEALPGHARFIDAAIAAGIPQPWRPISIVPDLTANSLAALLPAVVVLVGYTKIGHNRQIDLIKLLCVVGVANIIVCALQMVGGPQSAGYYYASIDQNVVSGMFTNRNHFAVYLSVMLPLMTFLISISNISSLKLKFSLFFGILILLTIMVLASGSRSGAAVLFISMLLTGFVFRQGLKGIKPPTAIALAALVVTSAVVLFLAYYWHRTVSIDRFQQISSDELRIRSFPLVVKMTRDFFPFGTGFGTFDPAFRIYEPDGFLNPAYFNNAHDDWLEIILTGGLPATAITLLFVAWFARAACGAFRGAARAGSGGKLGQVVTIVVVGVGIASLTDYPVRTPMFIVLLTTVSCLLADVAGIGGARPPTRSAPPIGTPSARSEAPRTAQPGS